MRIHVRARRHLFIPEEIGLGVALQDLSNVRRTIMWTGPGNARVVLEDNWREQGGEWTGFTIFYLNAWEEQNRTQEETPDEDATSDGDDEKEDPEEEPNGPSLCFKAGACGTSGSHYVAPNSTAKKAAGNYIEQALHQFSNTAEGWQNMADAGDALLKAAGGVQKGAESLWEVREEKDLMNLKGVDSSEFDSILHPDHLAYLRDVRRKGLAARYHGGRCRTRAKVHPNARRNVNQLYKQIAKDVKKARVLVASADACELEGTVSSPFDTVVKMLPDRTVSPDQRVVHDQRGVNYATSKFWHPPAVQPIHLQVARRVLWWKTILMAKKDISGAFRLLWVDPADVELFAGDLPWVPEKAFPQEVVELAGGRDLVVIYLVSSFGFSGSPGEWSLWGRATEEFHRAHAPQQPRRDLGGGFDSKVLVDDCILIEPLIGLRPWVSAEVFEDGVKKLLGRQAVNEEKDAIEGQFRLSQTVWGVIFETDTEKAFLPERRIQKGAALLALGVFDYGRKDATLKQIQQLRGILTGWASVIPSLVNELKAMDKFLGGTDGAAPIKPRLKGDGSPDWEEQQAWEDFWELMETCRWLSARTEQWATRFCIQLRQMLPPLERVGLPGGREGVVFVSSDATTKIVGAIDWKYGKVFRESTEQLKWWAEQVLTDEEKKSTNDEMVIHLGEMFSFVAFASQRAEEWFGQVIVYGGDNMIVKHWLQGRKSGIRGGRLLIRAINMLEAQFKLVVIAGWWRTYHNEDADYITRCSEDEFELMIKQKNWSRVDVTEAIHTVLEETQKFGPCFLWGGVEDKIILMQLKEQRKRRQLQTEVVVKWDEISVVEWAAKGRMLKDFEKMAMLVKAKNQVERGPVIACASLGQDLQLERCLQWSYEQGAWVAMVDGPKAVAWEKGEKKCLREGWSFGLIHYNTTEHGEAMARSRQCLVVDFNMQLPEGWEMSLVRAAAPTPMSTVLVKKGWEDPVWVKPEFLSLESGVPREPMMPQVAGPVWLEAGGPRITVYGIGGPCKWPLITQDGRGVQDVYVHDRRGPPGHVRRLEDKELWALQGRDNNEFPTTPAERQEMLCEGNRATGLHTAGNLLTMAGHLVTQQQWDMRRTGMGRDFEGGEALAQMLVWLRKWKQGDFPRAPRQLIESERWTGWTAGGRWKGDFGFSELCHRQVWRWAESWWLAQLGEAGSKGQEYDLRAGGRKKKSTKAVVEEVTKHIVGDKLAVHPFTGDVKGCVEDWVEAHMCGDKAPATDNVEQVVCLGSKAAMGDRVPQLPGRPGREREPSVGFFGLPWLVGSFGEYVEASIVCVEECP